MKSTIFSCYDFVTGAKPRARFSEYRVAAFDIKIDGKANKPNGRLSRANEKLRKAYEKNKKN